MNSNYTFRHSNLEMDSSGILPCTTYGSMEYSTESMNPTTILTNLPTNIHINPRLCASRSVYINKALYASQSGNTVQKCERIHYNPRFFKAPTTIPSANTIIPIPNTKEVKIHINPKFINKESHPKLNQPKCNKITDHSIEQVSSENRSTDNLSTISGIYVNPKFFNDLTNERIPEAPSSVSSNSKPNSDSKLNTPGEKYVTKYKIVKKKNSPATNNLKKNNLKKLNQILLRKSRYKLIKGKYLIYTSQKCNKNPNLEKNTLKVKTNMFANTSNKILPTSHNIKLVRTIFNKYNLPLINKKSILQQKIEARRKVKSSLNQTTSNSVPFRSKYKYVRSPANSQKTNIIKNHSQNPNLNKNNIDVTRSSSTYYSIGKTQLVRQSVLQKKIELRRHIRKVSSNINLQKVSKYRLVRSNSTTPKKLPCNNRTALLRSIRKKRSLLKFSSEKYRSEKIKKIALLTKKLKKNNVPCPFYSRFGHCKGKDRGSCLKLHDSKYITICKRFVKGECKDEKCTLSHEIRPEKMPTCHHYLAGLCKRTDCPFLHIKVNQKAPICRAFLQGFCADVFKCTKRHEYICPIFAEKGTCHRGKSCKLPHRTTTICSKLLKPDEFPLLNRKHIAKNKKFEKTKVSTTNENIIVDSSEDKGGSLISERYKEDKPKEFKRYFLASLSSDVSNENSCDSSDEPSL